MPDGDGPRRRVGDDTRSRIADLASGWSAEPEPAPEPVPRKKQKTLPPPPPGSPARAQLESQILNTPPERAASAPPLPPPPSVAKPPPPPPPRTKPPSAPPPIPRAKPTQPPPLVIASAHDRSAETTSIDPPGRVPDDEFGRADPTTIDVSGAHRANAQVTIIRDAASAILREPVPAPPPDLAFEAERGDPTTNDNATMRATIAHATPNQKLRNAAALRRKRGVWGDVRYVFTVVFGVRRAKAELAVLEAKQATRQAERRKHLVTLGRTAATTETIDHDASVLARDQLGEIEDTRAQHAGAVAAADAELLRVKRDRETRQKAYVGNVSAIDSELAQLAKQQEPLDKEVAAIKKRAAELRGSLARIDQKIQSAQASLVSVKGGKSDPAATQAEIATLKADRKAVERDEPVIAGELDAAMPRVAAIEAARTEAQAKRKQLEADEQADLRRVEELLVAIGAKRKVVDRASAESEAARDKVLFELGDQLYVDRPKAVASLLAPIDEIDLELGDSDRRVMELREILGSVDRWKLFRGWAVIILVLAALGAFAGWLIYMLS